MSHTICFEDIAEGAEIPVLRVGPLTSAHLMRWSASTENWHKIHYDRPFSVEHEKLPNILIHGSLKQQFLFRLLTHWVGPSGWVWKVNFQFRAMNTVGETLSIWARVKSRERYSAFGLCTFDVGIVNDAGVESTPGSAVVALPYREGPAVPNPFVPPAS